MKTTWLVRPVLACAAAVLLAGSAQALDRSVIGQNGMIAAGHPLAVQSGLKVLARGGSACDAAVAVATTLSVMMTDMMGPLGSGYALLWDPRRQELSAIDYNGVAPLATDPKMFDMEKKRRGPLAATVPGAVKGWEEIHKKCGTLPWAELWQDAIDFAEKGRPLDEDSAFHIRRHVGELGAFESWTREFLVGGQPAPAGVLHRRPDLAATYKQLAANGTEALYQGPVGDKLVAFMRKEGGLIAKDDLARYTVRWTQPIKASYRGFDVFGSPPNSSSITWMQILNVVEGYDLKSLGHNSPEYLRVFIEATKHAYLDAYRYLGDPMMREVPAQKLLSKEYAAELRQKIGGGVFDMKPVRTGYAHPPIENHATSHMVVIDRWGNAVSSTNTLGTFFGAGLVVEGTGLVLSNGMDWFDIKENPWTGGDALVMKPGARNRWTLSPGMIFKDGRLTMLVGGAGAESTMWGIAQPIANVIDFGMDPQKALNAPRFRWGDTYHYTGGNEVVLEGGIAPDVREALKKLGYNIPDPGKERNVARGTTNMIVIDPRSGAFWGGAAPNGRDFAAGY